MLIRSGGILAAWLCGVSLALAVEPPAPAPEPPKVIETKLPIKASYPLKLHPTNDQQELKAIVHVPESVVRDLAAKLNEKRSSTAPVGGTRGENSSLVPHGGMIVAGLAISLAMISFVALRQQRPRWALLGGAAGVVMLASLVANHSQANVAPPPDLHIRREAARNQCMFVIVPDGGDVEVFISTKPELRPGPR